MESLEAELDRAAALDVDALADAIETIGFECTRCGACCRADECTSDGGDEPGGTTGTGSGEGTDDEDDVTSGNEDDPTSGNEDDPTSGNEDDPTSGNEDDPTSGEGSEAHTATVFPDEVRRLQAREDYDWRDVARPMPYGLDADGEASGTTFEWALQTDDCGDCTFYEEDDGVGACTVHGDRPLICRTYPFSVALGGTAQPMGEAVDAAGMVRAHECEGLGRDISRAEAEDLAAALKERAVRELEEAIDVRENYEPVAPGDGETVVFDSEGPKRADGQPYRHDQ